MTVGDLLNNLVRDSGDTGTAYRTSALNWLNLVRQRAAVMGSWRSAKNVDATFTTSASNTTGIYELEGSMSIIGDRIYDQTNNIVIYRDTEGTLMSFDANRDEFGFPSLWADAGMTAGGTNQIRLWPTPNGPFVIRYSGVKTLTPITTEDVAIDPFFGDLDQVGYMLADGLTYYHLKNNDEADAATVAMAFNMFKKSAIESSTAGAVDPLGSSRLEPVLRSARNQMAVGRLDPSHYDNR